jgi:hypothetical protein
MSWFRKAGNAPLLEVTFAWHCNYCQCIPVKDFLRILFPIAKIPNQFVIVPDARVDWSVKFEINGKHPAVLSSKINDRRRKYCDIVNLYKESVPFPFVAINLQYKFRVCIAVVGVGLLTIMGPHFQGPRNNNKGPAVRLVKSTTSGAHPLVYCTWSWVQVIDKMPPGRG